MNKYNVQRQKNEKKQNEVNLKTQPRPAMLE